MNTEFYIVLTSMSASFILAVLIFIHLRKSLSGFFLFWINLGLAGWVLSNYVSNLHWPYLQLLWLNRFIFTTTAIASWGFAMFAEVFPNEKKINSLEKWAMLGALTLVVVLSLSPFLVSDIVPRAAVTDVIFGWGFPFYGLFVIGCLVYTIGRILRKYFAKKYKEYKKILRLLVVGVSIFLIFAITTNLILPFFFNRFELTILTPIYTSLFSFIIFWAILKHKFLNIKVIATELFTFSLWAFLLVQYLLARDLADKVSDAVLMALFLVFGFLLIKSVRNEVNRKEELQVMANNLVRANEQLKKLDGAKTEFISIASHQLRTPLTASNGFLSLIFEGSYGEIPENLKDPLGRVRNANKRLLHLVEDLLNITRIESGKMVFEFSDEKVEDLLSELVESFELSAKEKQLKLSLILPKKALPLVSIDRGKIFEAVSNLMDNAIKYTQAGSVSVSGKLVDNAVRIIVSDTGIGIPKEDLENIFGKFSRGSDQKRLTSTGTGLGLYFGKKVVEVNHGKMWVESDGAGLGSRFIIEIPVKHA